MCIDQCSWRRDVSPPYQTRLRTTTHLSSHHLSSHSTPHGRSAFSTLHINEPRQSSNGALSTMFSVTVGYPYCVGAVHEIQAHTPPTVEEAEAHHVPEEETGLNNNWKLSEALFRFPSYEPPQGNDCGDLILKIVETISVGTELATQVVLCHLSPRFWSQDFGLSVHHLVSRTVKHCATRSVDNRQGVCDDFMIMNYK